MNLLAVVRKPSIQRADHIGGPNPTLVEGGVLYRSNVRAAVESRRRTASLETCLMGKIGNPAWLSHDGRRVSLRRVGMFEKEFSESFLQEALDQNPELLPLETLDREFAPVVSLGREIDLIDNLFLAPNGRLTVVETKLWRNPESTREVVAQLLDYASRLAGMTYEEFEGRCRLAVPPAPIGRGSLYEFAKSKFGADLPDESTFVDAVSRTLSTGHFLLLVVGDGIREGLEPILAALHTQPHRRFTFGLVELRVFAFPDPPGGMVLMPHVVAKSVEIVRATVRVETTGSAKIDVAVEPPAEVDSSVKAKTNQEEFLRSAPSIEVRRVLEKCLDWAEESNVFVDWGARGASFKLRDPRGSKQRLTLFVLDPDGSAYTGWLPEQLARVGLDTAVADRSEVRLRLVFPEFRPDPRYPYGTKIMPAWLVDRVIPFLSAMSETVAEIGRG